MATTTASTSEETAGRRRTSLITRTTCRVCDSPHLAGSVARKPVHSRCLREAERATAREQSDPARARSVRHDEGSERLRSDSYAAHSPGLDPLPLVLRQPDDDAEPTRDRTSGRGPDRSARPGSPCRPSWASFRAVRRNRSDRGDAAIVTTPPDEPVRYTEIRALPRCR